MSGSKVEMLSPVCKLTASKTPKTSQKLQKAKSIQSNTCQPNSARRGATRMSSRPTMAMRAWERFTLGMGNPLWNPDVIGTATTSR